MAARSARESLKNGAAVGGSRLKIATDVASMLGSSEAPAKTGRSFPLARMEIGGAQRGTQTSGSCLQVHFREVSVTNFASCLEDAVDAN
jgi:hypothetical protein